MYTCIPEINSPLEPARKRVMIKAFCMSKFVQGTSSFGAMKVQGASEKREIFISILVGQLVVLSAYLMEPSRLYLAI